MTDGNGVSPSPTGRRTRAGSFAIAVAAGALTVVAAGGSVWAAEKNADKRGEKKVDFARDIRPIFAESCNRCHSADPRNAKKRPAGDFRLDDKAAAFKGGKSGKAIVAGRSADSLLFKLLQGPATAGDHEVAAMPKPKRGEAFKPLPKEQVDLIGLWIDQGAAWPG